MTSSTISHRPWRIVAGIVLLAAIAGAVYFYAFDPVVPSVPVTRRDIVHTVVASGRVATPFRVGIGSQITGTVEQVPVSQGQTVKSGQTLLILESSEARAGVMQAQVAVAQAEARLRQLRELQLPVADQTLRQAEINRDNAKVQYERSRKLFENGFVGKSALDDAQRNLDVANTQVESARKQQETARPSGSDYAVANTALQQARATLEAARSRLGYTVIRAPSGGTLIARNVERGDVVQPGKTLFTLSPEGMTQLVLQIDEKNLGLLKLKQPALASADSYPKLRFGATLVYINPGIDAQRGTVEVRLDVPDAPEYLRQDMTVSVDIEVARHAGALSVPFNTVRDPGSASPWVYVVADGHVKKRAVKLGLKGEGVAEILEGLREGERVVPASVERLRDGQAVRTRADA